MTTGVGEIVVITNLRRVSGRTCRYDLCQPVKEKREEDELKAEGRRALRVICSLSRFEVSGQLSNE